MDFRRYVIVLLTALVLPLCGVAQEQQRQIYNQAESDYELGRIEQARALLQDNLQHFEGNLRQSAYRLLALCCMSLDEDEQARYYAEQLVRLNNYYNSADDPARFQDLVRQLKQGITTTITTASSQSESINEAPAPVTIITAEMIEELGYNCNLNQILAAYVPGMTEMTSMDEGVNLSMHGAYAMGQELILIMENGHRLNTRFDNTGPTSYSVSTEKIDHIEVLRGPASSLYGNVAVSAVVNIITKSGMSIDGVKVKYGYGSGGTHRGDLTMGTKFMDADILCWASIYRSDGEVRRLGEGEGYLAASLHPVSEYGDTRLEYFLTDKMYVDGYKDRPAYDVGLTFKLRGFDLMFSRKSFKKVQQLTMSNGGYDYDRYYSVGGIKPGKGTEETHVEAGYTRMLRNVWLKGSLYSDWYTISSYDVEYDSLIRTGPRYDPETFEDITDEEGNKIYVTERMRGGFTFGSYREHTIGGYVRAGGDYRIGGMRGSGLVGAQYEHFSLLSRLGFTGTDFKEVKSGHLEYDDIISAGEEGSLSFFLQDKHYLLPQLILNAGLRYDLKYRQKEGAVKSLSPRLALMYVPHDRFGLKLSYSEAFADLSFYFRYITRMIDEEAGIRPQHLSAVQLTAMGTVPGLHLSYEANLFYNRYTNLLCWETRSSDFDSGRNNGRLTNFGLEGTASYEDRRLSARFTLYWCRDIDGEKYYYNGAKEMVNGVPHLTLNLHGGWKVAEWGRHGLKVYGHAMYMGRRLVYQPTEDTDYYVGGQAAISIGAGYSYGGRLRLTVDCGNLPDTDLYVCGPNYQGAPLFQRGRTVMAAVAWTL